MILYHGTSGANVEKILKEGIHPRGEGPSNWECESRSDLVYLTDSYAPYFAMAATDEDESQIKVAVFEVDVDEDFLLPDEDFLEQASRKSDICPLEGVDERTRWFRERLPQFSHHWKDSLKGLGTVGHYGVVEPEDLRRVSVFSIDKHPEVIVTLSDPFICIANQRFFGDKYRALTAVCFRDAYDICDMFHGLMANIKTEEDKESLKSALKKAEEQLGVDFSGFDVSQREVWARLLEDFQRDLVVRDLQQERES